MTGVQSLIHKLTTPDLPKKKAARLIEAISDSIDEAIEEDSFYNLPIEKLAEIFEKCGNMTIDLATRTLTNASGIIEKDAINLLKIISFDEELSAKDCVKIIGSITSVPICARLGERYREKSGFFNSSQISLISDIKSLNDSKKSSKSPEEDKKPLLAQSEKATKKGNKLERKCSLQEIIADVKASGDSQRKSKIIENIKREDGYFYKNKDILEVSVKASSTRSGTPRAILNDNSEPFITSDSPNQWILLESPEVFKANGYILRGIKGGFRQLKSWKVEGIKEDDSIELLDSQSKPLNHNDITVFKFQKPVKIKGIKITQTGTNSFNDNHLCISAFDAF